MPHLPHLRPPSSRLFPALECCPYNECSLDTGPTSIRQLHFIVDGVQTMIKEWLNVSVETFVPCPFCMEAGLSSPYASRLFANIRAVSIELHESFSLTASHLFSLEECQEAILSKVRQVACIFQHQVTILAIQLFGLWYWSVLSSRLSRRWILWCRTYLWPTLRAFRPRS
jgi:hypothetical protein